MLNYQGIAEAELSGLISYRCSEFEQARLVKDVSETEIHAILFSMPKDKSPGPDGYTVEFLKETWEIIKNDFVTSVQSFLKFGFLPKGVNTTILALIPKKKEVKEMKDYRPISCDLQVLSANLDKAVSEGKIGYHPKCQNIRLTHLCFADDLLVFTDGTKTSIKGILQVFTEFAAVSGLNISLETTLYMVGVKPCDQELILHSFPFASGTLPVCYLGLPLLTKRMTTSDYTPLIDRIRAKFGSWTGRYLSFAGRLQLIGSVIYSLTNFWMSAFRLPSACIKVIDGGLGLRSLKEANTMSCLKLIWRLLSSNSLWVVWLRAYLIRQGSFWSLKANTNSGSWMWRKLLKYRPLAVSLVRYEVKNGETVSFWHDSWSPLGCLIDITRPRGTIDMGITLHATVAEALSHRQRQHRVEHLNELETALANIRRRGLVKEADVVLWNGKGGQVKTKFTTKDTWENTRHPR
ncbi:PREDICTED: uncharacterized protein LOC109127350 [Camelina sativa]|uniref:Uncharacterized protein LOC109127350 n=1 Tax=Camelina sativa TaxID=90675 RepID=A0ABM1QL64_CAMSA|nr:PREDICTED: uncharacterized protein LOC109127350 [Camelina sativa]